MLAFIVRDRFGFDSFAAVRDLAEVQSAFTDNPFAGDGEDRLVHTLFYEREADDAAVAQLIADHAERGPERIAPGPRCLYVDYVGGAGTSKLTGAFIERRIGCRTTGRNVRSLKRVYEKMIA